MDYALIAALIVLFLCYLAAAAAMGYLDIRNSQNNGGDTGKTVTINDHAGEKHN